LVPLFSNNAYTEVLILNALCEFANGFKLALIKLPEYKLKKNSSNVCAFELLICHCNGLYVQGCTIVVPFVFMLLNGMLIAVQMAQAWNENLQVYSAYRPECNPE
jgi:hypothetical protein